MVIVMETNFNCGNRIRQLRNERLISQEQLALTAGITPAYLGLVERGKRNATVRTIERICFALGISLAEFFVETQIAESGTDELDRILLYQLHGLSAEDKQVCVQLLRTALQLRAVNTPLAGIT